MKAACLRPFFLSSNKVSAQFSRNMLLLMLDVEYGFEASIEAD